MRGYCFLPQLLPFLILALCLSLFFILFTNGYWWEIPPEVQSDFCLLCCRQNWQFRKTHPQVSLPSSLSLVEAKMSYIPHQRGQGEKQPVRNSEAPWTFIICLLFSCKISFTTNHQTAQDKQTSWGVEEGKGVWKGRGRKSHQFTRHFYAVLIPGVFIQPTDFPGTLLQVVCPLLEIIKAKGTFIPLSI